jgi:hypothetical protein
MKNGLLLVAAAAVVGALVGYGTADRSPRPSPSEAAPEDRDSQRVGRRGAGEVARARRPLIVTREARPHSDPGEADYDPVRAALLGARLTDLYDREPRDESWAGAMEAQVARLLSSDLEVLFPGSDLAVHCRTSSCRVDVLVDAAERERAFAILQLLAIGNAVEATVIERDDGTIGIRLFEALAGDNRDLVQHARWYRERRESMLDGLLEDGLIDDGQLAALRGEGTR